MANLVCIGNNHICPAVSGTVPHVGGPVTGPGAPTVKLGGLAIAVDGDICVCCGPADSITPASCSTTVFAEGKAVAMSDKKTAHGGSFVVVDMSVVVK